MTERLWRVRLAREFEAFIEVRAKSEDYAERAAEDIARAEDFKAETLQWAQPEWEEGVRISTITEICEFCKKDLPYRFPGNVYEPCCDKNRERVVAIKREKAARLRAEAEALESKQEESTT